MHTHAHHSGRRRAALGSLAAASVAAALLLVAAPASAHVHVDGDATAGSTATLTFRVPTESDTASTTSLEVELPKDTPLTSVSAQSKPGWDVEIVKGELDPPVTVGDLAIKSYVSAVRWTATGEGIRPGEFDTFVIRAGSMPEVESLAFPTAQGYSDGTVVEWSELAEDGAEEPAHPAPTLAISAATGEDEHGHGATEEAPADDAAEESAGVDPALGVGLAGLVVGAIGLVLGAVALVLARRRGTA